jgi:hypothetical protein
MIIKNYCNPKSLCQMPAADLSIIEDVTDIYVHANCFSPESIGDMTGTTTVYGCDDQPTNKLTRHVDFTRHGVRCRLIVTNHAYICSDAGKTIDKVSC